MACRVLGVGRASAPGIERRFDRLCATAQVAVGALRQAVTRRLRHGRGGTLRLAVDDTSHGRRHRPHPTRADVTIHERAIKLVSVRLWYRRRAVPLVWAAHPPGEQVAAYAELIAALLAEVAPCLRAGVRVALVADRGRRWPSLMHTCEPVGWS